MSITVKDWSAWIINSDEIVNVILTNNVLKTKKQKLLNLS